jgi:superfamily II DNA or RNA helicase
MTFAVGSLVSARGREWVVLPESDEEFLVLRPLGGTEDEVAGIHLALEMVEQATYGLPDASALGDYRSARLLRDAVRLGFRSSAGPFRSFGHLGFEPRPYQLVPLLMGLKLDPVRLLIADDVGIGKTIEAGLVARELLDRGEVERLAVLCPPALAEQWQEELRGKFHIPVELVLSSTARRLERGAAMDQSLFDLYPFVVVSTDYIKSDRRRDEFLRSCPELVIVDEAHTCSYAAAGRGGRHQRYELVKGLAADPERHIILVTATPHSGNEGAFRSLLGFLDPDFDALPEDLSGAENAAQRRRLAAHLVQRRRVDIRDFMGETTPFPAREDKEESYNLTPEYKHLFDRVLRYAREIVVDKSGGVVRQRVRWWSALALLRSMASSPAAAAATLRSRAKTAEADSSEAVDEIGRRSVLDLLEDEAAEGTDIAPGSDIGELAEDETSNRRRLLDMARAAEALKGEKDAKLQKAIELIKGFIRDGFRPIVFCRFIPTAEYVAEELRGQLRGVEVAAVTGLLAPEDREERIEQLAAADKRVLVCTDCLSEGINLQQQFDAVMHYDLSWNPTRHEQREGRVDRYGQEREVVRALTYYGLDNQIDGIVLDILLRKHKAIRNALGISVPLPSDADKVVEAIFEGLLLRESASVDAMVLPGFEEYMRPKKEALHAEWTDVQEREKRSRTVFAQETIKTAEVAREVHQVREAVGSGVDVERFLNESLHMYGAVRTPVATGWRYNLQETPAGLRESLGVGESFVASFQTTTSGTQLLLTRTHPVVEGAATYVLDTALDPLAEGIARRCGAIRTKLVEKRTILVLARFRYHLVTWGQDREIALLAEDMQPLAFSGSPDDPKWLASEVVEQLVLASPDANIPYEQARSFLEQALQDVAALQPAIDGYAVQRGEELLESHLRVRESAKMGGRRPKVEPNLPADIIGVYVYLPVPRLPGGEVRP